VLPQFFHGIFGNFIKIPKGYDEYVIVRIFEAEIATMRDSTGTKGARFHMPLAIIYWLSKVIFMVDRKMGSDLVYNYKFMAGGPTDRRDRPPKGFTLVELIIAAFLLSVLAAVGFIGYQEFFYRAQISQAITDIRKIEAKLYGYYAENVSFPPTLAEVREEARADPWNRPYEYWPITGDKNQKVRKDRNLHPLNTDFDLCSRGKDGLTNLALTAKASQDDIIRASDGKFVNLASKY
jgi:general secretion pathway protein G